ncbi:hypothetical protein [Ideonella sp. BN130291]|uniref:hypothetical protein n=1 Tax=Ideonella sp. BN130291 TaxID=3112940 RepID=UPI002E276A09|nr:hypothetical protein [Ideonella sp. BN130291]
MIQRRDPRALGWFTLVLLLHLGVFLLLRSQGLPRRAPAAAERPPLLVRLLWPAVQPRIAPPPDKPVALPGAVAVPSLRSAPAAPPAAVSTPAPEAATGTAAPSPPAPPGTPGPLVLTLPPQAASAPRAMRESALNDPRSNTRQTYSERFAATLGTDLTERVTQIEGGRIIRKGSSCTIVMDSRASTIDPYGPKWPGAAKSCD